MSTFFRFFKRIDWPNHLMAFISTLLGVWLAFSLGNYYERQREISRMEVAMNNVRQEIQKNDKKVQGHLAHLDSLIRAVSAFSKMINQDMDLVATERQMDDFLTEFSWFMNVNDKKPFKIGVINLPSSPGLFH